MSAFADYFKDIFVTMRGMMVGLKSTWKVFWEPKQTVEYPEQKLSLPPGTRGWLFNDTDDCIACKQCAVVCPVDCIYIETERRASGEDAPKTSNGTPIRLKLTRYAIDEALCCFCGYCTQACPTDSIYHTDDYEFSRYHLTEMTFDYLTYRGPKPARSLISSGPVSGDETEPAPRKEVSPHYVH
jgi:NADH-quinone oxidoreductase subunit I